MDFEGKKHVCKVYLKSVLVEYCRFGLLQKMRCSVFSGQGKGRVSFLVLLLGISIFLYLVYIWIKWCHYMETIVYLLTQHCFLN